jgi:hypothetical protein
MKKPNSHVGHILKLTLEYNCNRQLHAISKSLAQSNNNITRNIFETMQAEEGKAACKSNKITQTPMRNPSAAVTPSMKVSKGNRRKPRRSNKSGKRN